MQIKTNTLNINAETPSHANFMHTIAQQVSYIRYWKLALQDWFMFDTIGNIQRLSFIFSKEILRKQGLGSRRLLTQPMLHVDPNSIQIQATPTMESNHLPFCSSRREMGSYLLSKRSILPPSWVECKWFYDYWPLISVNGGVVSTHAIQNLMGVIKFNLQR